MMLSCPRSQLPSAAREKASNVRVVVRVRPMNEKEKARNCKRSVSVDGSLPLPVLQQQQQQQQTCSSSKKLPAMVLSESNSNSSNTATATITISPPRKRLSLICPPSSRKKAASLNVPLLSSSSPSPPPPPPLVQQRPANTTVPTRLRVDSAACANRVFDFDAVFPSEATQRQVYQLSVGDSVQHNLFRGYNTTVLAYGQTGSGKTYTMGQPEDHHSTAGGGGGPLTEQDGIVRRALHDLFQGKKAHETRWDVTIALNCLELFNEEFRDLLVERTHGDGLKIRNLGSDHGVVVEGVTNVRVHSVEQANELVNLASARRATSSTWLNKTSSRSHAIYSFLVSMEPKTTQQDSSSTTGNDTNDNDQDLVAMTAKLTLVDLAGSEQIKKSGVVGSQQKESININKDLFVLGKVVSSLADKQAQAQGSNHNSNNNSIHVPYRDSKLTQFLQDSLGGNCCTLLIACVSPADVQVDESLNTLRYAERSRSISNRVKRNSLRTVLLSSAESDTLRAENDRLQQELKELRKRLLYVGFKIGVRWADTTTTDDIPHPYEDQLVVLQDKLLLAEKEAKVAREGCLTVAHMADKWRDRCEFTVTDKVRLSLLSLLLHASVSVVVGVLPSFFHDTDRIALGHG
jgi:hypothetical protein